MAETLLPHLKSIDSRKAVTDALLEIFELWDLHELNQAELLGLKNTSLLREGKPIPNDKFILERAGHLLAIERALKKHFPYQLNKRKSWLLASNSALDNSSPLNFMLKHGTEGIVKVRKLIESFI